MKRAKSSSRYSKMKSNKAAMKSKVRKHAKQTNTIRAIGYLNLPKDFNPEEHLYYPTKKGTVRMSILPYEVTVNNHPALVEKGEIWYERTVSVHKFVGANNKSFVCPRNFDKKCPICEEASALYDNDEADEAKGLWPKKRMLLNVYINGEIKLWEVSEFLLGQELLFPEITEDEDEEYDGFYYLEKEDGYDLKIRLSEETFQGRKFIKPTKLDFISRKKDLPDALFDGVWDLDQLIECPTYAELKTAFYEEDEEEKKPKKKEPEEDEGGDEYDQDEEWDTEPSNHEEELNDMKLGELNAFIKENELEIGKVTRKNKASKIEEILEALGVEYEEEVEEEEEEEVEEEEVEEEEVEEEEEDIEFSEMSKKELLEFCKEYDLKPPLKVKKVLKAFREWVEEQYEEMEEEGDSTESDNKCPHGYGFGVETDEYDECDGCEVWDECADALED